jgi:putative DNA primase/helicase
MSTDTRDYATAELEFARLVNGAAHKLAARERAPDIDRPSIWHSPSQPLEVAHRFGDGMVAGGATPRFWAQQWWTHTGTHYIVREDHEIIGRLYQTLRHAEYRDARGDLVPWNPDQAKTTKVIHALKTPPRLIRSTVRPGSWLAGDHGLVIPCGNGLLKVSDRTPLPHNPDYFGTFALSFDYDPKAPKPARWLAFLDEVMPGDPTAQDVLQEWLGYLLSGRTDLQKALMLLGPKRCGKGTIDRLIRDLMGPDAHTGMSALNLNDRFGLEQLVGKTVATFSDHRLSMNGKQFVETVLRVTGEDTVTVQQKNRKDWVGKLGTRMIFLSNVMPTLPDASGAIVSRMLPIWMPTSFFGREDHELGSKLAAELPGILNWALDGLDRLTTQGFFTALTSEQNKTLVEEMLGASNPLRQFIAEHCDERADLEEDKQKFYNNWANWARKVGHEPGSVTSLTKSLMAIYGPELAGRSGTGSRARVYKGLRIHTTVGWTW